MRRRNVRCEPSGLGELLRLDETSGALLVVWGIGASLVLLWLGAGYGALENISRTAHEITDPLWRYILNDAATESGVLREVKLRTSLNVSTPILAGIFEPVILLPRDATEWPLEKHRSVLLHELAHVRRHDRATQFLAQFACAFLWFSPLHWYAAWRSRIERERACDDRVLASGVSPVAYADVLLDVAKTFRFPRKVEYSAVAMARYANLEERLLTVLADTTDRGTMTSTRARLTLLLILVFALSLGAIHADERQLLPATEKRLINAHLSAQLRERDFLASNPRELLSRKVGAQSAAKRLLPAAPRRCVSIE